MIAEGHTAQSLLYRFARMPREDYYAVDALLGMGVVCDGVTRDSGLRLPYKKSLWGKVCTAATYERPSKAGIMSELGAETMLENVRFSSERHKGTLWLAMQKANTLIYDKNCALGLTPDRVDYLQNNYGGCVAATAFVCPGEVHWAYLADCGVAIVDRHGNLLEKTSDDGPDVRDRERWQCPELRGRTWNDPEARAFIRKTFVNRPEQAYSYGTLTGEHAAMSYVRTGTIELHDYNHVLVYSDGAAEVMFRKDGDIDGMAASLIGRGAWSKLFSLLSSCVKSEGTLVRLSSSL